VRPVTRYLALLAALWPNRRRAGHFRQPAGPLAGGRAGCRLGPLRPGRPARQRPGHYRSCRV